MEGNNLKFKDDFNLNELNFLNVIDGLNKYFAEAETQRVLQPFIEVKSDKVIFYRFDAEMYLDKLIAWLRTKHGIFYYPGMEAKYAKAEKRIPLFSERMMDKGALNSLKKLLDLLQENLRKAKTKNKELATLKEQNEILKGEVRQLNREHIAALERIEKHNTELTDKLSTEIWEVNNNRWNDLHDIYKALGCDSGVNGHVDDFAEAVKALATCIKSEHDRYLEQRDKATADYQTLCEENQKIKEAKTSSTSDINKLIRDYCTKNDIIPPSPYFSDTACVEYLFSVVDLEREHRAAVEKQMVDDYEKDLLRFIYKEYENRAKLALGSVLLRN